MVNEKKKKEKRTLIVWIHFLGGCCCCCCCFKVSYKVEPRRKDLEEEAVYELSNNEDAPMSVDAHPTVSKWHIFSWEGWVAACWFISMEYISFDLFVLKKKKKLI